MARKTRLEDELRAELVAVRSALRNAIAAATLRPPCDDASTVDLVAVDLTRAIGELHQQLEDCDSLRAENAALRERVVVLEKSIRWALGEVGMDGWFQPRGPTDPPYWWREGLRRRAGLRSNFAPSNEAPPR